MTGQQPEKRPTAWRTTKRVLKVVTALGTLLGGIAGVYALVSEFQPVLTTANPAHVISSSRDRGAPAAPASPPRPAAVVTPVVGECVGANGNPLACREPAARLVVASSVQCSELEAIGLLGVDGGRQMDVEAATIGDVCTLTPGPVAVAAGATAMDIKELAVGGDGSVLAVCYAGQTGLEVSCSQPHVMEAVSGWITSDETNGARAVRCEELARNYVDRTFEGQEPLQPRILQSADNNSSYRCAIKSPATLTESVWKVGGRQLPR